MLDSTHGVGEKYATGSGYKWRAEEGKWRVGTANVGTMFKRSQEICNMAGKGNWMRVICKKLDGRVMSGRRE